MLPRLSRRLVPLVTALILIAGCASDEPESSSPTPTGGANTPGGATTAPAVPKRGGQLVYGTQGEIASLDPAKLNSTRTLGGDRAPQIFDTLLALGTDGSIVPRLAQSMDTKDGGKSWVLKLRAGMKFTDGTPFDAEAVIFNVNRILDPANASPVKGSLSTLATMTAEDSVTVRFDLKQVNGSFPQVFTSVPGYIASPTAIRADPKGFGAKPVGAGPFTLKEWTRDSQMVLVRNPDFVIAGQPYVDQVTIRILPDPTTLAESLMKGEVDIAASSAETAALYKGNSKITHLGVNPNGGDSVVANASKAPGNDVRIREAIALAFEPAVVNKVLSGDNSAEQKLTCPPFVTENAECLPGSVPKADVARAKKLVSEYAAEGKSTKYTLLTTTTSPTKNELMQLALANIGLQVEIQALPSAQYNTRRFAHDYELLWTALGPFDGAYPKAFDYFHSSGANSPNLVIPELDAAIEKGAYSPTQDERIAGWKQAQKIMTEKFLYAWFAPFPSGFDIQPAVKLQGSYGGGSSLNMSGFWLER